VSFGVYDIGGCDCGCGGLCAPCALVNGTSYTVAWQYFTASGSASLAWVGVVGGYPTWATACIATGLTSPHAGSLTFNVVCRGSDPGGTSYWYNLYAPSTSVCAGSVASTAGHNTGAGGPTYTAPLALGSFTCSPLNIPLSNAPNFAATITP